MSITQPAVHKAAWVAKAPLKDRIQIIPLPRVGLKAHCTQKPREAL